jgi:F420-dependent oxidoreductase-like protein
MDLVEIPDPVEKYERMTQVARVADEGGWDSIWVFDHFHTVPRPALEATFESWTITATLARDTRRIRVGQMCTCNGYRHPALLAKMASTVDVASHGRLNVGLGAGWYEHEWRAYGYGFPELRDRMGMLGEACEIIHRMWTEDFPRFAGKHYTVEGPINEPKGVQGRHPPLWIAGGGPKVTLKLVARWGDASNMGGGVEGIRQKLHVLRRHCEDAGRPYADITKSTNLTVHLVDHPADAERATRLARGELSLEEYGRNVIVGTPATVTERLQPYLQAGIDYFIVTIPRVAYDQEPVRRFASEVIPRFQGLALPAGGRG